ncbi:MAG: type II toxin-antitoxin system VapC family toxin [Candidatus Hydrothermarchaeaceae archaeon]
MFLDTTVIVEILRGNEEVSARVEEAAGEEPLMFSMVQIGELADWCHINELDPTKVLKEVKAMATVVGITEGICLEGSRIKRTQRKTGKTSFSLLDGMIASSAMAFEQELLTSDGDFEGLENTIVL